jgi:hypothetical protein
VTDPSVDPLVPGGNQLLAFVDATLKGRPDDAARSVTEALGEPATLMAATVIGNFQMMNRVADATGMPVGKGSRRHNAELIESLGLDRFDHLDSEVAES